MNLQIIRIVRLSLFLIISFKKRVFLPLYNSLLVFISRKIGTAWVQVANATLNFGIICQKKGVAYGSLLSVKH